MTGTIYLLITSVIFKYTASAGLNSSLPCCLKKRVGGVSYTLEQEEDTSGHNCLENCTYQEDGNPGQIFCFGAGDREVVCDAIPESNKNCTMVVDKGFGGTGGRSFNDAQFQKVGYPSKMEIWSENTIHAIQVTYDETPANKHGGSAGSPTSFQLTGGEKVTQITGTFGMVNGIGVIVCQLIITTNRNSYTFGKQCTGSQSGSIFSQHPGCDFAFISGSAGEYLDSIAFHWCC